jgi:hypothetical protein
VEDYDTNVVVPYLINVLKFVNLGHENGCHAKPSTFNLSSFGALAST